jgi:hypothetical protein
MMFEVEIKGRNSSTKYTERVIPGSTGAVSGGRGLVQAIELGGRWRPELKNLGYASRKRYIIF